MPEIAVLWPLWLVVGLMVVSIFCSINEEPTIEPIEDDDDFTNEG